MKDLKPDETYVVKRAPYGETVHKTTGKELMEEGFTVRLTEKYDADVFEIVMK